MMAHILAKQIFRDFDEWLAAFEGNASMRRENGSKGAVVWRDPGRPNEVLIYFKWDSLENANKYFSAPKLTDLLDKVAAGVPLIITESYEVDA